MQFAKRLLFCCAAILLVCAAVNAQQASAPSTAAVVPRLVNFSGKATDEQGKPISGIAGITFSIYSEQYGGASLWMETQNVTADARGNYNVQLGASSSEGLPLDLFASGEARWLGVRTNNGEEQPRVLLLSVPYALKAADSQTLGGLPASAFLLAGAAHSASGQSDVAPSSASATIPPPASSDVTTSGGTVNALPLFTTATNVQSSILTQTGSGTTGKIGVNIAKPATSLDVNGAATIRGTLSLPAIGTATTTAGKNSQPLSFTASSYNSGTGAPVSQNFRWQAEAAGNDTANASGTLNLLHAVGSNPPTETGLGIAGNGQIRFAPGQSFAGLSGVVSNVALTAPSSDFTVTGSPISGSGTLNLKWNVTPTSNATANAIVKRDSNGNFSAGTVTAGTVTASDLVAGSNTFEGFVIQGTVGIGTAVTGTASGANSVGVVGQAFGSSSYGVYGVAETGYGVYGYAVSSGDGVLGESDSQNSGVAGISNNGTIGYGVYGSAASAGGYGVFGTNTASGGTGVYGSGSTGVYGSSDSGGAGVSGTSVGGWGVNAYGGGSGTGVLAGSDYGYAGWFNGNVNVEGTLSASTKDFKIDHPVDPANKYLVHASVESSEMTDIYTGNITTDALGEAMVQLPDWFEALNTDFRYQLTVIGQFAQAIVAHEIEHQQFQIRTNLPNVKVSWQVTGVRHDAYAKAHPLRVEEDKPEKERGFYIHPELFGAPVEKGILWATSPRAMTQWKAAPVKATSAQKETSAHR